MLTRSEFAALLFAAAVVSTSAQTLPRTIRGYRVFEPARELRVSNNSANTKEPKITLGEIKLLSVGLTGIDLAATASLKDPGVSGTVDLMIFREFRVNGLEVEIREYRSQLKLVPHGEVRFAPPLDIFIPVGTVAKTAYKELVETKTKWSVSATVLVFGRFRRFGFTFKRVVPVRIDVAIDNPIPRI